MPSAVAVRSVILGAPVFNPRALPGLALWLDATKLNLAADAAVTSWPDLSGAGKDAAQGTGSKQPTYKTGILNGRPVVRFDGGDGLATPSIDFSGTATVSVFLVVLASGAGALQMICELTDGSTQPYWHVRRDATDKPGSYIVGDVGQNSFQATGTLGTVSGHVVSTTFDLSLATNETNQWLDGSAAGSRASNVNNTNSAFQAGVVYIGARSASSLFYVGDIAELLVYSADRTAERPAIEAYLRAKWGTP